MPAAPHLPSIRGWCPSAHAPMATGDGWIVRARVGCRPVTSPQWTELRALADEFGNGLVEFTMRGNVQVRGVPAEQTTAAASRLVTCGLAGVDEAIDRRRIAVVNPLAHLAAPAQGVASVEDVVSGVEDVLERHGADLPPKWWASVDPDVAWPLSASGCDVAVRRRAGRWQVVVAGIFVGEPSDPLAVLDAVAARCARERCRARDLAGVDGAELDRDPRSAWWGPQVVHDAVVAGVAPAFGVADAPSLAALADVAALDGVTVHPTPERGVLLVGGLDTTASIDQAVRALAGHGWIVSPDDQRRFASTCIGARGCSVALIDTWHVAADLAPTERTHISGCSKRCGVPADVRELVATDDGLVEHSA